MSTILWFWLLKLEYLPAFFYSSMMVTRYLKYSCNVWFINHLVGGQNILSNNYFDNLFNVFTEKNGKILWCQLLQCIDS